MGVLAGRDCGEKMKEKIKAIIFDVDGVLIDVVDENGLFLWKNAIDEDLGISYETTKIFFANYWEKVSKGKIDTLEAIALFLKSINSQVTAEEFLNYWHKKDSNINHQMLEVVKELKAKDYPLYLGTNQEKYRVKYLWENFEFNKLFREIHASCSVGFEKPDKEYFLEVEKRVGVASEEILFIDDSEKNVISAKECGWHAYHHASFEKTYEEVLKGLVE